jgi:6-pyruvoyltetrahydropterin/6-carboxytetrahydropterin synthase
MLDYDGVCANIHGHSYRLLVTVSGNVNEIQENPKLGMVIDFGDLKNIISEEILDHFDHSLAVYDKTGADIKEQMKNITRHILFLPFQPTCENLTIYFAGMIKKRLPANIQLHSLRLHETPASYAEWYAEDNIE